MTNPETARLAAWLEVLCRMLPGIAQAVVLTDSSAAAARWPRAAETHEDVMSAARQAASQRKCVTTTLSASPGSDSAADTIIALPLNKPADLSATLAILVTIKPSQQAVVMQILQWGEDWLGLLSPQREAARPRAGEPGVGRRGSPLPTGRSGLIVLGVLLLAGLMAAVSGTYRVTATATLEGITQRVIVAPFDGYIASAYARAGETVAAGDVIARLDTQELLLQQQRYAAERNEYDRQYRQALVARDKTEAHIFKSQVSQADAQLGLVQKKLERSSLVSSLDGVIISGDLSRSLGAPVKTGEVLFEVAPLDEYRLIILVNEKQVADVRQGMRGMLTLKALPGNALPFSVHKVSPVFEEQANGIAYRVEARLDEGHDALRPGMQGVAKIDVEQRSYLWIYLHDLLDVTRLWAWRWMP